MREDLPAIREHISHPPLPASMVPDNQGILPTEFWSRKENDEKLMALLKSEEVKMLGICGMGGVGKTTLAKKMMATLTNNVFGESVIATVSQSPDKHKIQSEIADQLRLELEGTDLSSRAKTLDKRLRCERRILVVLDDVWEYSDLKDLEIPGETGPTGYTVLVTSRNRRVFKDIPESNILEMEILRKDEAWTLFKKTLDNQIEFPGLAQEIAQKCRGLPLALVSVAGALKGEKEKRFWKDVLQQLNGSCPNDLPEVLKEVYIPLKLSYDSLSRFNANSLSRARDHAQSIFLLCSLFPEDSQIPLKVLTSYAMGLPEFEGIGDLKQVRNRTEALVVMLKSRFLLLEGWNEEWVRMHDVIRDVAIYIASEPPERLIKCSYNSTWISPFIRGERIELSKRSKFPNLRLLLIENTSRDEDLDISGISLEGMEKLNVLSILWNSSLTSLRLTTQDLGTLILENCYSLKTISVVGELLNLKILICRQCYALEEIASKRSLDEENFEITFSKLESLQLYLLPKLSVFYRGIESIEFPRLSQIDIKYCPQLEGLLSSSKVISTGDDDSLHISSKKKVSFGRLRKLQVDDIRNCEDVFFSQIRKGSFTHLKELTVRNCADAKILFPFSIAESLRSLKFLRIEGCGEMVKVIEAEKTVSLQESVLNFPLLEELDLIDLPKLEIFCNSASELPKQVSFGSLSKLQLDGIRNFEEVFFSQIRKGSFTNLMELTVRNCADTKILFPFSIAESLRSLKLLTIERCWKMVKVIEEEEMECLRESTLTFPLLEELNLRNLPKLEIFCNSDLELPKLVDMYIWDCPKFGGLNLGYLMAENLKSLKSFSINNCSLMNQVSSWDEENESLHITITFLKSERLHLSDLWNLRVVDQGIHSIEPPLLTQLHIKGRPSFEGQVIHNGNHSLYLLYKQKVKFCNYISRSQIPIASLAHLRELTIEGCDDIHSLFSFSIAQTLTSLKILSIERCTELVKVIEEEEEHSHDTPLVFPHLLVLYLSDLPKLKTFCKSALTLPKLVKLDISNCREMGGFNLGSLATPNLECLERVKISSCKMMELVFMLSEEENTPLLFPHLQELHLYDLPKLQTLCKAALGLPKLVTLDISNCHEIGGFNLGCLPTPTMESLKSLKISSCEMMELVFLLSEEENTPLLFPRLQELHLSDLPKLRTLCKAAHGLPKLVNLDISNCHEIGLFNLGCLPTPTMESLKSLKISSCEMMELVFMLSEEENTPLLFPRLQELHLSDLPKLRTFCKAALGLPKLVTLDISNCHEIGGFNLGCLPTPTMESLKSLKISSCEMMELVFLLSEEENTPLLFPRLQELHLSDLPKLRTLCKAAHGLPKLVNLDISNCHEIGLFNLGCLPTPTMESLKSLKISSCEMMELVFMLSEEENTPLLFPRLQELHLSDLPKLRTFCKAALGLPKLVNLGISKCHEMGGFNLGYLDTTNLKSLESLKISSCEIMEVVFLWCDEENKEGIHGKNRSSHPHHITFPNLTTLDLSNLHGLTNICQGVESIEFPLLTHMIIQNCSNMKSLASATTCSSSGDINKVSFGKMELKGNKKFESLLSFPIAQSLKRLRKLDIYGGFKEMTKVVEDAEEQCSHDAILCFSDLKELHLSSLPKFKSFCNSALGLPKLVNLQIHECPEMVGFNSRSLTTPNLESLERIMIQLCGKMEHIFLWNEEGNGKETIAQCSSPHPFPKLKFVRLSNVPRITSIYKGVESIEFIPLNELRIEGCPKLTSLVSATNSSSSGDINNKVYFPLSIWDQIPIGSLEELYISDYDEISSLFSSSLVAKLINLKILHIRRCKNMVKVIEEVEVEEYSHETTILFPHVERILLSDLPSLKLFCDWKCALEFQPLNDMLQQRFISSVREETTLSEDNMCQNDNEKEKGKIVEEVEPTLSDGQGDKEKDEIETGEKSPLSEENVGGGEKEKDKIVEVPEEE